MGLLVAKFWLNLFVGLKATIHNSNYLKPNKLLKSYNKSITTKLNQTNRASGATRSPTRATRSPNGPREVPLPVGKEGKDGGEGGSEGGGGGGRTQEGQSNTIRRAKPNIITARIVNQGLACLSHNSPHRERSDSDGR